MEDLWKFFVKLLLLLLFLPLLLSIVLQAGFALIVAVIPVVLALVLLAAMSALLYLSCQGQSRWNLCVLGALFLVLVGGAVTLYQLVPFVAEGLPWLVGMIALSGLAYGIRQMRAGRHRAEKRLRGIERTPFMPQQSHEEDS